MEERYLVTGAAGCIGAWTVPLDEALAETIERFRRM
jgi:nucleoside-diphosphate-sugar epimerase